MGLLFLDDRALYLDHALYRSRFAREPVAPKAGLILHHSFWMGPLTAHHELSLKSRLLTQSEPYQLWLWMPADSIRRNESFVARLQAIPTVAVKSYRAEQEAEATPYQGHLELLDSADPVAVADGFRLLALYKYGGVYADMDVLFLRDVRGCCGADFCYQWSFYPWANNAVLSSVRESAAARFLVESSIRLGSAHARKLFKFSVLRGCNGPLQVLPSFAFDPSWVAVDSGQPDNPFVNANHDEFFLRDAPVAFERFFPESYAYHWHGRWASAINGNSLADRLLGQVRDRFQEMCRTKGWAPSPKEWA